MPEAPSKPRAKNVIKFKETRKLRAKLPEKDKRAIADKMAAELKVIQNIEDAKKLAMAEFKEDLETHHQALQEHGATIREGVERNVTVAVTKDFKEGTYKAVRTDTKAVIENRKLSPDERQTEIPAAKNVVPFKSRGTGEDATEDNGKK